MTNRVSPTWKRVLEVSTLMILAAALAVLLWSVAVRKDLTVRQDISQSEEENTSQRKTHVEEKPSLMLTADKTVTITTDKTEYEQGEEINARLSYEDTIYAWDKYAWSIQTRENDSWITILRRGEPYLFCSNIPECEDVDLSKIEECTSLVLCEVPCWYQVQSTPKLTWDQTYKLYEKTFQCKFIQRLPDGRVTSEEVVSRTCAVFEQVPPGKYKTGFEYTLAPDPNDQCSRDIDIKYTENEIIIKGREGENPRTKCLGSCKCMKECNKEGPLYFIPVEEGFSECSINSVNKTCCCSGV